MNLVEWLQGLMTNFGAGWVMWLLLVLSVISVAIMLERGWFYWSLRDDIGRLAHKLREALRAGDLDAARKSMEQSSSAEAVVAAGRLDPARGSRAADEAMQGAAALQRMKLEKRLAYLATLGNNAPFIGLFGTVIGIVQAFEALGKQDASMAAAAAAAQSVTAPAEVMAAIAEALVATAVGIGVAIPAVAAFNYFNRQAKSILANTEALSCVLLAHLAAVADGHATPPTSNANASDAQEATD
jgi:biopolymer transport protein ExbB/TolQ